MTTVYTHKYNGPTDTDFIEFVKTNICIDCGEISAEKRIIVVDKLFEIFKLDKNVEQLIYVLCNNRRQIVEACAGSGKTTSTLLKVITHQLFKDIIHNNTVILTYTTASKSDVVRKYGMMKSIIDGLTIKGLGSVGQVYVKTIHAFFKEIIMEYSTLAGVRVENKTLPIVEEHIFKEYIEDAIEITEKNGFDVKNLGQLVDGLHSLYSQSKEMAVYDTPERWNVCGSYKYFKDFEISLLQKVFQEYDKRKHENSVIDFTEYAYVALKLLQLPDIMERWRKIYSNILIDEYQDVTESQSLVFQKLFRNDDEGYLIAIGDGDQSIYKFRGAHSNGCTYFESDYKTGILEPTAMTMSLNRRCPNNIVETAKKVIESVSVRRYKNLVSNKPKGLINIRKVLTYKEECLEVLKIVKDMDKTELKETVICFRNNQSGRLMQAYLRKEGINISREKDFNDRFEFTIKNIVSLLKDPGNMMLAKNHLFKVVPKSKNFTKLDIEKVINDYLESKDYSLNPKDIFELDFSQCQLPNEFEDTMLRLHFISKLIRDTKGKYGEYALMCYFMPPLIVNYICKYYLNWQMINRGLDIMFDNTGKIKDEFNNYIYRKYTQKITYDKFIEKEALVEEDLKNSDRVINLCTFHGLKGLEFNNVIVIDLHDEQFPGFELNQAGMYGYEHINDADDEAKRLFYVVLTRSKANLHLFFRSDNPCRYINYITNTSVSKQTNLFMQNFDEFLEEDDIAYGNTPDIVITDEFINVDESVIDMDTPNMLESEKDQDEKFMRWLER